MFGDIQSSEDFLVFDKYKILNNLDPLKETIVAFTCNFKKPDYNHVDGYFKTLFSVLEEKYNVIYIGYEKNYEEHNTLIYINNSRFKNFIKKYLKSKVESNNDTEYDIKNHKVVYDYINERLSWIKNIKYITGIATTSEWRLMLQKHTVAGDKYRNMYNEIHDYSGNDSEIINDLKNITDKVIKSYYKYCSPLAFMQIGAAIFYNILLVLVKNNKDSLVSIDGFANDPAFFFPLLDSMPVHNRNFYFANDNRGTRHYKEFPIAQLQHLVYDVQYESELKSVEQETDDFDSLFSDNKPEITSEEKHSKNFIFMGTILNVKGNRMSLWNKFLKNLSVENSIIYVPPVKQGIIFKQTSEQRIKQRQQNFTKSLNEALDEITSHPLYNGYILPTEVNSEIEKYKYTFIMRCVSCSDSLNYRPVQYTYHKVLFFLDPLYDPDYLQIPKHIQDKLIVNNAEEIMEKIKYFNAHPEEREAILNELWVHFEIDKWLHTEYYKQVIFDIYK